MELLSFLSCSFSFLVCLRLCCILLFVSFFLSSFLSSLVSFIFSFFFVISFVPSFFPSLLPSFDFLLASLFVYFLFLFLFLSFSLFFHPFSCICIAFFLSLSTGDSCIFFAVISISLFLIVLDLKAVVWNAKVQTFYTTPIVYVTRRYESNIPYLIWDRRY